MERQNTNEEEFKKDPKDLFFQADVLRFQYDGLYLVGNSEYMGTVNQIQGPEQKLTVKISLITIPNWKSYARLSFKVCSGSATSAYWPKDVRTAIIHHEAFLHLNKDAIHAIKVKEVKGTESNIPNFQSENSLQDRLDRQLVYELTIDCNRDRVGQYRFMQAGPYPVFKKLKTGLLAAGSAEHLCLRFLINFNFHVIEVVELFSSRLRDNIPDYAGFYPGHPTSHFLQVGDYPKAELRPSVNVPASPVLDTWLEYTTTYGYGAIYEHKIAVNERTRLGQMVFDLRVMDVSHSADLFYVGFIQRTTEHDIRIEVGNVLKVNFDPVA